MQIVEDDQEDLDRAFVNEKFVASYLIQYLRGENTNVIILESERLPTPQMLETILEAYQAGEAFQKSVNSAKK